ncbi:D-2-hydroxyacid dehydrogenase [Gammaproteobacteria bacterium]|nr:D-2-hydroxyacid dehydrogenase [Gammaproteobacteria bacterium]
MKTVFLDFASLGPDDLDVSALNTTLADVIVWPESAAPEINKRLATAEVAVVNKVRLDSATLRSLPNLKLICLAATGTDNINLEAAKDLGIAVANIRRYCTPSVVQHVFTLILALTQHLSVYQDAVRTGLWQNSDQFCLLDPPFRELQGKTMGIIGIGELGGSVAGVARAFGMRVIAARLPWRIRQAPGESGQSAPRLPLHELLQQADIVSLHCPLTEETHQLIDAAALEQMKKDALLINTARGGLVDSRALVDALQNEEIGGAGIDVLPQEPPKAADPLLEVSLPNLIVTPHIAWSARESRQRALDEILENIVAFSNGLERNRVC